MADHTAKQETGSLGEWTAFLETAGRLYKYEQLKLNDLKGQDKPAAKKHHAKEECDDQRRIEYEVIRQAC